MTAHRILINAEYLNAHLFVFLFVYALQDCVKVLFYANFHKLRSVQFILRHPVYVDLHVLHAALNSNLEAAVLWEFYKFRQTMLKGSRARCAKLIICCGQLTSV